MNGQPRGSGGQRLSLQEAEAWQRHHYRFSVVEYAMNNGDVAFDKGARVLRILLTAPARLSICVLLSHLFFIVLCVLFVQVAFCQLCVK